MKIQGVPSSFFFVICICSHGNKPKVAKECAGCLISAPPQVRQHFITALKLCVCTKRKLKNSTRRLSRRLSFRDQLAAKVRGSASVFTRRMWLFLFFLVPRVFFFFFFLSPLHPLHFRLQGLSSRRRKTGSRIPRRRFASKETFKALWGDVLEPSPLVAFNIIERRLLACLWSGTLGFDGRGARPFWRLFIHNCNYNWRIKYKKQPYSHDIIHNSQLNECCSEWYIILIIVIQCRENIGTN